MRAFAGITLALLAIYHANGRPRAEVDCTPAPYGAWALVRYGSLDLRPFETVEPSVRASCHESPDGSQISRYPPGSTLAVLPFVAPLAALREAPLPGKQMFALGKLAAAAFVAAAGGLLYLICRDLAPAGCWPATILFALGTCLHSVASQALWMHGPATFWLCAAIYLLLLPTGTPGEKSLIAGLAFGLAVVTRPTTVFMALATSGAMLLHRQWRQAALLTLGWGIPAALLCVWNYSQFGHPILGGYAGEYGLESPPWWLGLAGLLIAPSRGLLVYSPALLLVPLGFAALRRRKTNGSAWRRDLLLAWSGAAGVTILYYARWHEWKGGWCYGPRFLCELMPVFCLVFGVGYEWLQAHWQRLAVNGLVALSVAIHFVGVFGHSGYADWQLRHDLPDQGRCLFEFQDTQIEAHARSVFKKGLKFGLGLVGD